MLTWSLPYLIAGCVNSTVLGFMLILLLNNFFRKRTVGTFLLILAYGSVLLNEVFATVAFFLEMSFPVSPSIAATAKILHIGGVFSLVYSINWIYFFSNRHLIRDNDLFKSIYISLFGGFIGAIGALAVQNIYEVFIGRTTAEIWYSTIILEGADFHLYLPNINFPQIIILVMLFAIGSITYLRLIIRTIQLERKAKDIVTKKGLRVVTTSIFLLLSTGVTLGAYIFGAGNNPISSSLLYVIRGLVVIAAVVTGYIGWIMPEWIVKSWRGTAWLTKVYTGKLPTPPKSAANEPIQIEGQTSQFTEVTEM